MRSDSKLILVEGLCGAGKSTLSERLHYYLLRKGISSCFYDEGAKGHPASLNWHAFLREDDYTVLLERFPAEAGVIRSLTIREEGDFLIPYREVRSFEENAELYAYLRSRELCWTDTPVATFLEFSSMIQRQWGRFAQLAGASERVFVLEGVFFQHQIHDLLRHYQANDQQIAQHIQGIANQIAALHPRFIYLSEPNVREQQIRIASIRSKPHFSTEANIQFMDNRKRIEYS